MLAAKVKKEMDSRTYNITDWKASGSAKIWAGYDNKSGVKSKGYYNSARFTVSDHADVHLGNTNTGDDWKAIQYQAEPSLWRHSYIYYLGLSLHV